MESDYRWCTLLSPLDTWPYGRTVRSFFSNLETDGQLLDFKNQSIVSLRSIKV